MSGYNTKNLREKKPVLTVAASEVTDWFKISEGDSENLVVQVDSAVSTAFVLETSYDGGVTKIDVTTALADAFGSGIERKYYVTEADADKPLGPLCRIRWGASTTVTAIWRTVRS